MQDQSKKDAERQAALDYHEFPRPGKLEIRPTKPMATARDLARAYSPGVAEACTEIAADPAKATRYTAKRNLVAVISNGTAVLGLGNIGAQASKPVMEGKAVLFKKFAGIDCFDLEVDEADPERLADLICRLEPTFGAVNLEDIKAPECFIVERLCRERMTIPVFHDDQHGTAIVVSADRVLRTVQSMTEDRFAKPILVGRPEVIAQRIDKAALAVQAGRDFDIVNPESDERYWVYWQAYYSVMRRRGVTPDIAKAVMRTNTTAIAATMVQRGDADSMICGVFGQYLWHLGYVTQLLQDGRLSPAGALSLIILDEGPLFVADTHVNIEQTPETLARTVIAAARHVRRFGVEPKIALCSGSQFGNLDCASGRVMRGALAILDSKALDFEYEGEMHTDAALDPALRERLLPGNRLTGRANVLVYANTDAAGAARNLLKSVAGGLEVGPILMGMGNRAHIVTPGVTPRGLLNIVALGGMDVSSYS